MWSPNGEITSPLRPTVTPLRQRTKPIHSPLAIGTSSWGLSRPFSRAFERPIAMACLRLLTFLPLPRLFNFPRFISCISVFTCFPAAEPYLRVDFLADFFVAFVHFPGAAHLPAHLLLDARLLLHGTPVQNGNFCEFGLSNLRGLALPWRSKRQVRPSVSY